MLFAIDAAHPRAAAAAEPFVPEVVHVAATPLVSAPARLAAAYARLGAPSMVVAYDDYPGALKGVFVNDVTFWKDASAQQRAAIAVRLARADVVHVHNDLPLEFAAVIRRATETAAFVYQVHSPRREGPLYVDRSDTFGIEFDRKLVVGQFHPRLWPGYRPVPNIVDATPSIHPRRHGERLVVMYTPSHGRAGRWQSKRSPALDRAMEGLARAGLIEVRTLERPLPPHALLELRRTAHVTVDEIVTGGHHQVSLEGLCCGNVVISGADYFSKAMACAAAAAEEVPPFLHADETSIADVLAELARDAELTAEWQRRSFDYFRRWLMPQRLAQRYLAIYREAIDARD